MSVSRCNEFQYFAVFMAVLVRSYRRGYMISDWKLDQISVILWVVSGLEQERHQVLHQKILHSVKIHTVESFSHLKIMQSIDYSGKELLIGSVVSNSWWP